MSFWVFSYFMNHNFNKHRANGFNPTKCELRSPTKLILFCYYHFFQLRIKKYVPDNFVFSYWLANWCVLKKTLQNFFFSIIIVPKICCEINKNTKFILQFNDFHDNALINLLLLFRQLKLAFSPSYPIFCFCSLSERERERGRYKKSICSQKC